MYVVGGGEAITRAKKKIEFTDNVLDTIGSVLSILEFLENEED